MTDQQQPEVTMIPCKAKCQKVIGLDKAGKPIKCGRTGYVLFHGFEQKPLCQEHASELMQEVVEQDLCLHPFPKLNHEQTAIVCNDCHKQFPIRNGSKQP